MSDAQEVKINGMKLEKERNAEHVQFNAEHLALLVKCDPRRLGIGSLYDEYLARYNDEDDAYKKIEKSDFTHRIWEADHVRDEVFGGLVLVNRGNMRHYEEAVRYAAARVKLPLDAFGNLSKKPLNEQTAGITNILQELRGEYAKFVEATGIGRWVDDLDKTNNAVAALVKERADETVAKETIAMKDARTHLDAAYRMIVERVEALALVEGPDNYATYILKLNEIIHRYMQSIKVREGRNAKKKVKDKDKE